ncbi:hypothetical protein LJR296_004752 [Cupriavidus necator]|uniref:hypothetical protein n=1 Tax=Cupriavidus necator TaxID=106590 RepID=UPI003ECDF7C4
MGETLDYFSVENLEVFLKRITIAPRHDHAPARLGGSYAAQSGFPPPDTGDKTNNIVWHDCSTADMTGQCAPPAASVSAQIQNARTEPITQKDVATCRGAEQ